MVVVKYLNKAGLMEGHSSVQKVTVTFPREPTWINEHGKHIYSKHFVLTRNVFMLLCVYLESQLERGIL